MSAESYLTTTVHYIDQNLLLQSRTLETTMMAESPTADNPEAVDSHFHLDRLEEALGISGLGCVWGILNYCDPQHFRRITFPRSLQQRVAVGIHPQLARRVADVDVYELENWLRDPRVVAISELGMDHSAHRDSWGSLLALLERLLKLSPQRQGARAAPLG